MINKELFTQLELCKESGTLYTIGIDHDQFQFEELSPRSEVFNRRVGDPAPQSHGHCDGHGPGLAVSVTSVGTAGTTCKRDERKTKFG